MEARSISRQAWAGLVGVSALALGLAVASRLDGQGIRLEGDDWSLYTIAQEMPADGEQRCIDRSVPPSPYAFICQTDDGVAFLAMLGRCPTVTYTLTVSQLPEGKTRFPVEIAMRQIGSVSSGLINLHNETTGTRLSMQPHFQVGDAFFEDSTGTVETVLFDPPGALPGGDILQSTDGLAGGRPPSTVRTQTALFDLAEGENVIRFDSCVPYDDGDHGQFFLLWIGPDETDLEGTFEIDCAVGRQISPRTRASGDLVSVTLSFNNLPVGTTVTETLPSTMFVQDAGGGAVVGDTIKFTPPAGASSATYVLESGDSCGVDTFSGTYVGPGGCEGTVSGDAETRCVAAGGMRIEGDDWAEIARSNPPLEADPCVGQITACTTVDGVEYLHTATSPVRLFDVVYFLNVESLPGDVESGRYPVALRGRRLCDSCASGVNGIRNATTSSWIGFTLGSSAGTCGYDAGAAEVLISGFPNTSAGTDSTDPAAGGVAPAYVLSSAATLALNRGMNEIHIENFGAAGQGSDDGDVNQLFTIVIGPAETGLVGSICVKTEETETSCDDGLDNDCDGFTDDDDSDCACVKTEETETTCNDGVDNDCDGSTDAADTDCQCVKTEDKEVTCNDGVDNDCDGSTDAEDSDCEPAKPAFRRGDSDAKGGVPNITDGIFVLNFLFLGGPEPPCREAANADDKGGINITDGIYILNYLFQGGPAPPAPGPDDCGPEPPTSPDNEGCVVYDKCASP